MIRLFINWVRIPCNARTDCRVSLWVATNRASGCWTAVQVPLASVESDLLCEMRGLTECAAMSHNFVANMLKLPGQ